MNIDGLSLSVLVKELNTILSGARIEKIFQVDPLTLVIVVYQRKESLRLLISANPENPCIMITENTLDNPAVPPAFCMLLRKHLVDGRIAEIVQHKLDRIVTVHVDILGERGTIQTKSLTIELMGRHSNIILCRDNVVIDAIKRIGPTVSRVRQIMPDADYSYPPGNEGINILNNPGALLNVLRYRKGDLVKNIVANTVGVGPLTAKEIVYRAGLPLDVAVESLDVQKIEHITEQARLITSSLQSPQPTIVFNSDKKPTAVVAFDILHIDNEYKSHYHTLNEAANNYCALRSALGSTSNEQQLLMKRITSEIERLKKKEINYIQDLSQADNAEYLRRIADTIMANIHKIKIGMNSIQLPDLYSENSEQEVLSISLDPTVSAVQNAQIYYEKYNKCKRAQTYLNQQLEQLDREVNYLEGVLVAIEQIDDGNGLDQIKDELILSGYLKAQNSKRSLKQKEKKTAPMVIELDNETKIFIGRNNFQNDQLTMKQAQADDLWFHAKNIPGSHVILKKNNTDDSSIYIAAQLAAYFSKARLSSNVPVDYTMKRYVKKPQGSKPGFVIYSNHKTCYVTPDEEFIKSLLIKSAKQ